ncbi:MAG TPA: hypothetical protein VN428_20405 [Bryobacteraceae bacterium]|nr:hypothetical protein [Bryobacteraceae bacterium]
MLTRQAHPGPSVEPYDSLGRKLEDGLRHQRENGVPYPVLVDDLEGKVHQVYGGLADPAYLIDAAGRVAFYNKWTNARALDHAIERLIASGGHGVVEEGVESRPALGPILLDGWPAIRRGLPQSYIDLETAMPGSGTVLLVGHTLKPLFRRKPEHERAKAASPWALALGTVAGTAIGLFIFQRVRR